MATSAFHTKPDSSPERVEYYRRLREKNAAPLWEVLADLIPAQPRPAAIPALWRYRDMRALLLEAGKLITPQEAERRVLILENPGMRETSLITHSMYSGLQLVAPGEITPTHRHATSAIRFVIESETGYTAVEGERTTMHPGDLILTPAWTYHDHGNPGNSPVIWLDGLDVPIVNMLGTSFAESYPGEFQPVAKHDEHAEAPFNFSYARSRAILERLYREAPLNPWHGAKMEYAIAAGSQYRMPTIGAFLQLLPAGFRGAAYRSTDSAVYCAAEGIGTTIVAGKELEWAKNDIFVVPSWSSVSHNAHEESVLFSFSDHPLQRLLGLWREENI